MSRRLKVLIVDDDATARISLSGMIPWSDYGYTLLDPASDGEDALSRCQTDRPDIVITDMKMPGMDGITFLRRLKESGQHPYILALSGYDDFFLLREAMRLGASDYILKMEINGRRLLELLPGSDTETLADEPAAQREHLLRDLLNHYFFNDREFSDRMVGAGISFRSRDVWCFCLSVADLYRFEDASEEEYRTFRASLANIIREITEDCLDGYQAFGKTGEIYVFGCLKPAYEGQKALISWTGKRLVEMLRTYLDISCRIGISVSDSEPGHLYQSARQAAEAVHLRYFSEDGQVVLWEDVREETPFCGEQGYQLCLELRGALKTLQEKTAIEVITRAEETLTAIPPEERLVMLMEFYSCAQDQIRYFGQDPAESLPGSSLDTRSFMQMHKTETMRIWLAAFRQDICSWIRKNQQESGTSEITRKACRRIRDSFDTPLSLTALAGELGVSSGYLSTLLKKATGRNFSEYLAEVRISRAKKLLLETDSSLTVIAEKVGFSDPYYFNRQFKKMAGLSPGEWRKKARSVGADESADKKGVSE